MKTEKDVVIKKHVPATYRLCSRERERERRMLFYLLMDAWSCHTGVVPRPFNAGTQYIWAFPTTDNTVPSWALAPFGIVSGFLICACEILLCRYDI